MVWPKYKNNFEEVRRSKESNRKCRNGKGKKSLRDKNDFKTMNLTITYKMINILHGALMLFGHAYAPAYNIPVD